ncbi:MAG TPA: hypothetical protein VGM78_11260 [Ilumatobacteraceae bacterium]
MTAFWYEQPRDVVRVSGVDALTYLQSQISQDIRNLGDGQSAYTFVLQPMGKVDALARVTRRSAEELIVDTDAGFGPALLARLLRFKIRVKAEIEVSDGHCIAVRGAVDAPAPAIAAWGRHDAFDLLGADAVPPRDVRAGTQAELQVARIEAGWPAMGAEITDASIPAETGVVDLAVSFTKGCYPGQELVERMDSRGSTAPRFVRRLRGTTSAAVGTQLVHDGKLVGAITSLAESAAGWVALAIVARSVAPGETVELEHGQAVVEESRPREDA